MCDKTLSLPVYLLGGTAATSGTAGAGAVLSLGGGLTTLSAIGAHSLIPTSIVASVGVAAFATMAVTATAIMAHLTRPIWQTRPRSQRAVIVDQPVLGPGIAGLLPAGDPVIDLTATKTEHKERSRG